MRRPIPGVVEDPCWLVAGESTKAADANLILKPIQRCARRCRVIFALAEFVFMCNRVDLGIELVDIRANPRRLRFDTRIDLWDKRYRRVDSDGIAADLREKVGDGLNAELDPIAKTWISRIPQLYVLARIEPSLCLERRNCAVIEAGPAIFPSGEVSHPVGDVDINTIDAGGRDLANALHVHLAPIRCVWADPDVLFPFGDPKRGLGIENSRLAGKLALQPLRMFFGQGMRAVRMGRDTFESRDVDERLVVYAMGRSGDKPDSLQLFGGIPKALVSARDVIIHFDSVDAAGLCLLNNLICILGGQRVSGDAHLLQPGSVGLLSLEQPGCRQERSDREE